MSVRCPCTGYIGQSLAAQIQAIATEHHGDVALFAENLKTHETVAISPDTPVQTASVIKLAILYEALEQVRSGKAHFDDKITLTKADQVPGSGVLLFFDTPLPLTLKDVLTMMIVMSDNSATQSGDGSSWELRISTRELRSWA